MEEANEEKSRSQEFIPDLPVTDEEADQACGGSETLPFAGQTVRLRIASTNNQGHL